jgi:adenylate kinase
MESGQMLRQMSKKDSRIRSILNKGTLVPDEETLKYVEKYLGESGAELDKVIFDGYPRTINQYKLLKGWIEGKNEEINCVIYLNISRSETIKRLSARRQCEKCGKVYNLITNSPPKGGCECGGKLIQRVDDNPEAINKRLAIFNEQTEPIIKLVENEGLLIRIDGERPIDVIFADILGRLKKNDKNKS